LRYEFWWTPLLEIIAAVRASSDGTFSFVYEIQSYSLPKVFPLTASIAVPSLILSEKNLEFGMCLLGKPCTLTVALSNKTTSSAMWRSDIPPGKGSKN